MNLLRDVCMEGKGGFLDRPRPLPDVRNTARVLELKNPEPPTQDRRIRRYGGGAGGFS